MSVAMTARVHVAALALRDPVAAADRTHGRRRTIFLELDDGDVVGWGECATAEEPGSDATVDEVLGALSDRVLALAVAQLDATPSGASPRAPTVSMVPARPSELAAAALVDAALWDRRLRSAGESLASDLGVSVPEVGFAGVIGIEEGSAAVERAMALVAAGVTRLRIKVSRASGTAALDAVLDAVHVPVVADANASLRAREDARVLDALCERPIAWLEQPFAAGNLADHAELAARGEVLVGLDESVRSIRAVRDAARYGAAGVVCVKPPRLGGLARALEAMREASSLGLAAYVGGYFEAGLGRAVLGALSAAAGTLDGDVAAPSGYLVADPCSLAATTGGRQPLHLGPGCGPAPDRAVLRLVDVAVR